MKRFENPGRITFLLCACGLAGALTGCASRGAISFRVAAPQVAAAAPAPAAATPSAPAALAGPTTSAPAEAAPVAAELPIGPLSAENIALLESERSLDLEVGFQLYPHVAGSLSFHCTQGEETLGCAAPPAAQSERPEQPQHDEPVVVARNSQEGEIR
ncbi:MAG TPA: hypothetical protein VLM85_31675 [Polyangiaceae bacterium]|nr:hypothetical protein [Polyangiaceae bacterium]